jgi:hypothetical protein
VVPARSAAVLLRLAYLGLTHTFALLRLLPATSSRICKTPTAEQSSLDWGSHSPDGSRRGPTLVAMTRSSGYGDSAVLISSLAERGEEK